MLFSKAQNMFSKYQQGYFQIKKPPFKEVRWMRYMVLTNPKLILYTIEYKTWIEYIAVVVRMFTQKINKKHGSNKRILLHNKIMLFSNCNKKHGSNKHVTAQFFPKN